MTHDRAAAAPRPRARIAGIFYLATFVTGTTALLVPGRVGMVSGLVAAACYVAVTILFYGLFKPVNRNLSLLAAAISLAGCAIGPLGQFGLLPFRIHSLVFFGCYCLLIGFLVARSTFLPRALGALLAFGGLGWLTFLSPPFANQLSPYVYMPGVIGEGALTLWLLVFGVNLPRWQEQARGSRAARVA